jgi:nucleoside triphosphate pyrophosphatase
LQELDIRLASASPRRLELLQLTGLEVRVTAADVDERRMRDENPQAMTRRLALAKAKAVDGTRGLVLGADTVVVDGTDALGKPKDYGEAREMLEALRGRSHQVITSIALINPDSGLELVDTCKSHVPMRQYSDSEIEHFLANGDPLDKAGAYAIQDKGFVPVDMDQMNDCFANVMGLPLCHVARNLPVAAPADVPAACQAHTGYQCPIYTDVLEGKL